MASLSDILSTLQNGVVAINNFGIQLKTTLTRISTRFGNYLLLSGGTLTGDLTISKDTPVVVLNKHASGQAAAISGNNLNLSRWFMSLGNTTPEAGANAGSDFTIYRYTDAGALIGPALNIARSDATATLTGNLLISKSTPVAVLNKSASGQHAAFAGNNNSLTRWFMSLGNDVAETGANAGSNFSIYRYDDAGALIGTALDVNRATGELSWTGSAWTAWTPTVSAGAGVLTTASGTGRYKQNGKTVHFTVAFSITTNGTGSSYLAFTLPVNNVGNEFSFCGREQILTGKAIIGFAISASVVGFQYYDASYPGANNTRFAISGTYEAA